MSVELEFETKIKREHVLAAIQQIDREGVPARVDSQYYDLVLNGKSYPPKLVVAYAFRNATGRTIETGTFNGGLGTKAFAALDFLGFKIFPKEEVELRKVLERFVENALLIDRDREKATLKTGEFTGVEYRGLGIQASFGKGNFTDVPWIGFLSYGQTIQQGIYPVILFSRKKTNKNFEVCFGISETKDPLREWDGGAVSGLTKSASGNFPQSYVRKAFSISRAEDLARDIDFIVTALNEVIDQFKQHYEKDTATLPIKRYWAFQANPKNYNIVDCLSSGNLRTWSVSSHKDSIKVGDKVILWVTGENSGVYALLTVASEPFIGRDGATEKQYWIDESENTPSERVKLEVDINLASDPILKDELEAHTWFANRKFGKPGVMGTNFEASVGLFEKIHDLASQRTNDGPLEFERVCGLFNRSHVEFLLKAIRAVVEALEIDRDDARVVFSCKQNTLQMTVGQRYCLTLRKDSDGEYFGLISKKKINRDSSPFDGVPSAQYTPFYDFEDSKSYLPLAQQQIAEELARTRISGFKRYDDSNFRNAVFGRVAGASAGDVSMENKFVLKSLNTIFYGPPGTGKTKLASDLMAQFASAHTSAESVNIDAYVQSLPWWQVFALVLDDLGGARISVNQIIEHRFTQTRLSVSNNKTIKQSVWGQLQSHTAPTSTTVLVKQRQDPFIFDKDEDSKWSLTSNWKNEIAEVLEGFEEAKTSKSKLVKNTKFITFHQSYSYEDFIEGIRPDTDSENGISYAIQAGSFKKFCDEARIDKKNKYLFVIDEINRGNISKIFGEFITLIEDSKREGRKYCVPVELQYSRKEFNVPENVYIVGTMNTADRSIASLDLALRRRFSFIPLYPDEALVPDVGAVKLNSIFKTLNLKIRALIGEDYQLGHTFFLNLKHTEELREVWFERILPLLQEYFYGDYEKLRILVPTFIHDEPVSGILGNEGREHVSRLKVNSDFDSEVDFVNAMAHLK